MSAPETLAPGAVPPKRVPHDAALIERLCERVYRSRLGSRDAANMVAKDQDGGAKLRSRAMAYEATVRATLDAVLDEPLGASITALLDAGQRMQALESAA